MMKQTHQPRASENIGKPKNQYQLNMEERALEKEKEKKNLPNSRQKACQIGSFSTISDLSVQLQVPTKSQLNKEDFKATWYDRHLILDN